MNGQSRWSRILVVVGLIAMLIGAVDPLEGSLVILLGTGMVALGAVLGQSRHRRLLSWSLVLVAVGVGAMWGLSAFGGIGGESGHSIWWGLLVVPYPVGWILGVIGAVRRLREASTTSVPADMQ